MSAILSFIGWTLFLAFTLFVAAVFFFFGFGIVGVIIVGLLLCWLIEIICDATGGTDAQEAAIDAQLRNRNPEKYEAIQVVTNYRAANKQVDLDEAVQTMRKKANAPTPNAHKTGRSKTNAALRMTGSYLTHGRAF